LGAHAPTRVMVGAQRKHLRAAIDGEDVVLSTPIEFAIEPGALRVLVPRGPVA